MVRWSAAKGIGRVTSRLTSVLSEEVLSSVLELFSPGEVLLVDIWLACTKIQLKVGII